MTPSTILAAATMFAVEYESIKQMLDEHYAMPLTPKQSRRPRYNAAMRQRQTQNAARRDRDRARTAAFTAAHGDPNRDPANRFWMPGLYDGKGKRRKKIFDILISRRSGR